MRKSIVSKFLSALLPPMHARRHKALCAAVDSSLRGQPLAVTALGRGLSDNIDEKHQIKRMDRVLSNHHFAGTACSDLYRERRADVRCVLAAGDSGGLVGFRRRETAFPVARITHHPGPRTDVIRRGPYAGHQGEAAYTRFIFAPTPRHRGGTATSHPAHRCGFSYPVVQAGVGAGLGLCWTYSQPSSGAR